MTRPALERALAFLELCLRGGPRPAREVRALAQCVGVGGSIERAKRELGIISTRTKFQGPATWSLPVRETPEEFRDGLSAAFVAASRSHKSLGYQGRILLKKQLDEAIRQRLSEREDVTDADRALFKDLIEPPSRREVDRRRRRGRAS